MRQLRNLLLAVVFVFCTSTAAGQLVSTIFNKLSWNEDFSSPDSNWKQVSNQDEIYIVQNREYIAQRLNKKSGSLIVYAGGRQFTAYRAEAAIILDKENNKSAAAGLAFSIQNNMQGAFVLEINTKNEYRVLKYNGREFLPVSVDENGLSWKKSNAVKGAGQLNALSVYCDYRQYDIYINGTYLESLEEVSYKNGKMGFYLSPASKVKIKSLKVYTKSEDSTASEDGEKQLLNEVIRILKANITKLNRENDSLQKVISKSGKSRITEQEFNRLKEQNKKLNNEIAAQQKKVKQLEAENKRLQKFKEDVQKSQQGDIVINLSDLIDKERQKNAALEQQIIELKKELEELKR